MQEAKLCCSNSVLALNTGDVCALSTWEYTSYIDHLKLTWHSMLHVLSEMGPFPLHGALHLSSACMHGGSGGLGLPQPYQTVQPDRTGPEWPYRTVPYRIRTVHRIP